MSDARTAQFSVAEDPRPGSPVAVLGTWTRQETLLLLRQPVAIFFSLAFPLVIYLFIGLPYADTEVSPGVRFIDVMFPGLIGTAVANLVVMGLPIYLSELRTRGVDRRYRLLPLSGGIFAVSIMLAMLGLAVIASGIIIALVGLRHGLLAGGGSVVFWLLMLAMIGWLSALGFFLGSLPTGPRTIQAVSAVVFFVMYFGSGAAIPIEGLPPVMQSVLAWNPLKQWFDVLIGIYTGTAVTMTEWLKLLLAVPLFVLSVAGGLLFWRRRT